MSCLQGADDLAERDRDPSSDGGKYRFVGSPEPVAVLDADHASASQRSGVHDSARSSSAHLTARIPGEIHAPVTGTVGIGRRIEGPCDGERFRERSDPTCGIAGCGR